MADYEVTVRLRNDRILSRIRAMGFSTLSSFCSARGLRYQEVSGVVTMRTTPTRRDGKWRPIVQDLATALGVAPDDLFTRGQLLGVKSSVVRYVDEGDILSLDDPEVSSLPSYDEPQDEVVGRQRAVASLVGKLRPRERAIITRLFGLDGREPSSYQEVGDRLGVTAQRVRQIEDRVLQKARHPSRARDLRPYFDSRFSTKEE